MRHTLRPRSGCLLLCLCASLGTLLLQSLWIPELREDQPAGGAAEGETAPEGGQRAAGVRRLALRLETLSSQLQRLSKERSKEQPAREELHLLIQSLRRGQDGLISGIEDQLKRLSRKIDLLSIQHHPNQSATQPAEEDTGPREECTAPEEPEYPACAEKVEFLRARWQSDPCYAFYGVDGSTCSILTYLSRVEDFCPRQPGRKHSALPWHQKPRSHTEKQAEVRTTLSPLYEAIGKSRGPAVRFIRSRVERMSRRWMQAAQGMRRSGNKTFSPHMKVLLYPGVLAGRAGQQFGTMVERGGPLGELVQWADLSACLTVLGHNLTFSTSQQHLHSLIGSAPGRGGCPIQRPLDFDLIYTDYHGLVHLHGAMGLAFQHYQCRFRILDSFGTEPAFNVESYASSHGYNTLWGSWGLRPAQYMTMFPHTPDNSFLGFVGEEVTEEELRPVEKENLALVYGKQDYMWKGKADYIEAVSAEVETHATVYQTPGGAASLPGSVINHGLLNQQDFLKLLQRAKVFVGLGFPFEGPAPLEAIALGCIFLQPGFQPPRSSDNSDFYKGKPTTRKISSQNPYAEDFIGKPYVWTVDMTNLTAVRQAVRAILHTKVKPFVPREFTCDGMLERLHAYITHQDFCSASLPTWPPEGALKVLLGPLGQSCVSACRRSSLVCEPALFQHLNSPAAFTRMELGCSNTKQEVNHLFPAYSPWGRQCGLQGAPLLFSCAGADPNLRRLCPCRAHLNGQVALCSGCL